MKASNDWFSEFILLLQNFFIKSAIDMRRSQEAVPNEFEFNIRLRPPASKPASRPEPPLVIDAIPKTNSLSITSKAMGSTFFIEHLLDESLLLLLIHKKYYWFTLNKYYK